MSNPSATYNEFIVVVNIFYLILLFVQIPIVRFFQKYNDVVPVEKKISNKILCYPGISLIISAFFMSIVISETTTGNFILIMFYISVISVLFSFLTLAYLFFYFSIISRKTINKINPNNKCKWYQDETGIYSNILLMIIFISPLVYLIINKPKSGIMSNDFIQEMKNVYGVVNMFYFVFFYCKRKERLHLERVVLTYIADANVSDEIYKEEKNRYLSYIYNKKP